MSDRIEAVYHELEGVSQRFVQQSDQIEQMRRKVMSALDQLRPTWQGRGSEALFQEMQTEVLPAVERLKLALEEAGRVTSQVSEMLQNAEDEASLVFQSAER